MKLASEIFHFSFLTPCFSGGAEGRTATRSELRIPPIRGHLRFWHRAAFGLAEANAIWGTADGDVAASRLAVRLPSPMVSTSPALVLPHKSGARQSALPTDKLATLALDRLPQCTDDQWRHAVEATMIWLIAGTLGYRANRAAGSVWPAESWTPKTRDELIALLASLTPQRWSAALIGFDKRMSAELLRETASDTPHGPAALYGCAEPRIPSPVRLKVIRLGAAFCLLALAPPSVSLKAAESGANAKPNTRRWGAVGAWDHLW